MIKARATVKGMKVIDKRLKQLNNKKKPLEAIAKKEVENAQRRIKDTKRDPDGKAWKPWARSTRKQRMREGTVSGGLLYRLGNLYRSIRYSIIGDKITVFSRANYSKYLRLGTTRMPSREFLGWSNTSIKEVERVFKKHLKR